MRLTYLAILLAAVPVGAMAQANQSSRTFEDSAGRQVTCTVGQLGSRQTRGFAVIGRNSSRIDSAPTNAAWAESGCAAEMDVTAQERYARTMDRLNDPPPIPSFEESMAGISATLCRGTTNREGCDWQGNAIPRDKLTSVRDSIRSMVQAKAGTPIAIAYAWGFDPAYTEGFAVVCGAASVNQTPTNFLIFAPPNGTPQAILNPPEAMMDDAGCRQLEGREKYYVS